MNSSEYIIGHNNDRYPVPPPLKEQPPQIARYLRAWDDDTFHTSIAYTDQETGHGERILRGAYYGCTFGGVYESGYFKVDTQSNESGIVDYCEAEFGDESDLFATAMQVCRGFWTIPFGSELPELSSKGRSLLADGGFWEDEDGEGILLFVDYNFNRDALGDVSGDWPITVCF